MEAIEKFRMFLIWLACCETAGRDLFCIYLVIDEACFILFTLASRFQYYFIIVVNDLCSGIGVKNIGQIPTPKL